MIYQSLFVDMNKRFQCFDDKHKQMEMIEDNIDRDQQIVTSSIFHTMTQPLR
jgi:hypothetical protein